MSEDKCDHIVAFKFGFEESSYTGELIFSSEKHMFKQISDDDYTCTYCPNCGELLQNIRIENDQRRT